ncbi:MAG: BrnA antitoxin family protein [Acetobacteraceae bacterium]
MSKAPQKKARGSSGRAPAKTSRAQQEAAAPAKAARSSSRKEDVAAGGWATELTFDVREPKLAVSLRLDADVLRFFRAFGSGYQTRINEVLKAFMHARQAAGMMPAGAAGSAGGSRKARAMRKR